jgi:hypothetical protein
MTFETRYERELHGRSRKKPPPTFDELPIVGSVGAAMNHLMTKKAKQVKAKGAASVWAVTVAWVDELLG